MRKQDAHVHSVTGPANTMNPEVGTGAHVAAGFRWKGIHILSLSLLFLVLCLTTPVTADPAPPVKVIFDTDYSTDCDDPGALAVLHALADLGEVEILATGASTSMSKAPGAIDVVNTYYGRPDLPIGATKVGPSYFSAYVDHLYDNFPHDTPPTERVRDAVELYREILAAQPDDSVVLVTVGYLTNIAELLQSEPDEFSPLDGRELVSLKVREWACMGGNFFTNSSNNVNFTRDQAAAYYAIQKFPKKLTFVPREVASEPSPLRAGQELLGTPETNPVRAAYQKYFGGGSSIDRHVADPATVLYAVRGARDYWEVESAGSMDINPDATFTWNSAGIRNHHYLVMKGGFGVYANADHVEGVIRELMARPSATAPELPPPPPPGGASIAHYTFEELPGSDDPGNPIKNHGDSGAILDLTDTGGPDGRDDRNSGGYGAPGREGFGSAFDVLASGDWHHHSTGSATPTGGGLTTAAAVPQSALQGIDGAFTYEAIVRLADTANEQTILSHDGPTTRGFHFRVLDGNLSLYTGSGSVGGRIPTSGAHAFAANRWFHVAVVYTGAEGVADNLRFYWTALDASPAPEEANLIGTAALPADLPGAVSNLLGVGTTARHPFRFELAGLIDDVRLSGVGRAPADLLPAGAAGRRP